MKGLIRCYILATWRKGQESQSVFLVCCPIADPQLLLSAISRELPGNVPFALKKEMIQESTQLWREPADALLDKVDNTVANHFSALCKQHFKHYTILRNLILYVNRNSERCLPASHQCFEQRKTYSPPINLWKA